MKTWVKTAVVAAVPLVMGLPVVGVAVGAGSDGSVAQAFAAAPTPTAADDPDDQTEDDEQRAAKGKDHDARGHRHGPPPWARGHGPNGHGAKKPGKAALDAWKKLTPTQKAKRMAELARLHADGMERWADCVAAGRTDCERPVPPGLAKREPR